MATGTHCRIVSSQRHEQRDHNPLTGCSRGPVRCGLVTGSQGCDKQSLLSPSYKTTVVMASKLLHLPDLNPKQVMSFAGHK